MELERWARDKRAQTNLGGGKGGGLGARSTRAESRGMKRGGFLKRANRAWGQPLASLRLLETREQTHGLGEGWEVEEGRR